MRQSFEQATAGLRDVLGNKEHQTMLVAMYEGTEQLSHNKVSEFAVIHYLEDLKLAAMELRLKGKSGESYRSSLFQRSKKLLRQLLSAG